jgi:hypothetical protein
MKKIIEVHDNYLNPFISNRIEEYILKNPIIPHYYINNITKSDNNQYLPGFGLGVFNFEGHKKRITEFEHYSFLLLEILYRFAQHRNLVIMQVDRIKSFIHLPSPNPGPDIIHVDKEEPHLVGLYYVTDSDGDTILYEDDEVTEIQRITPKKGRMAFFDGSIKHCSTRPAKSTRSIINFNFHADFF